MVVGGTATIAVGVWFWSATHPGDTSPNTTATDATGALKSGEERPLKPGEEEAPAPAHAPQPQAGGEGAMSRGPRDPPKAAEQTNRPGAGRTEPLTNAQARALAKELGFNPVKDPPFNSRGATSSAVLSARREVFY